MKDPLAPDAADPSAEAPAAVDPAFVHPPAEALDTPGGLLRSSGAATLAQFVRVAAILLTHLALRRLIPPADWGLRDWAESLFLLLATVRDLGLPSHVVRLRPIPLGNLLRVQLAWGGALGLAILAAAPVLAGTFRTPRPDVALVLQVMVLYLLLEGLASVPLTHFEAGLRIGRSVVPELARTLAYCTGALALAMGGWGVWSFVLAMVGSQAIYAGLLWWRARPTMELHFERGQTLTMLAASVPLGSIWLLAFAVTYADALILGSRFPDTVVGGYMFAYVWAFFASRVLQQPIGRALYPALVQFGDRPAEQFLAYRLATKVLLAIEVPAALFLFLNADLVVRILGGERYAGQAGLLRLLAFAPLVDPLGRFGGELLVSRHRDRDRILSLVLHLGALVAGGLWLSHHYGPVGMAWANFLPLGAPILIWSMARIDRAGLGRLVLDLAEVYVAPLPLFALAWWSAGENPWLRFALSALAGLASLGWFWWRFGSRFLEFFRPPGGAQNTTVPASVE
ncbi:MAG: oligosaccharide flippase family protein [Thermoanaerobaculia bacterium]